jgi:hypothetical protein
MCQWGVDTLVIVALQVAEHARHIALESRMLKASRTYRLGLARLVQHIPTCMQWQWPTGIEQAVRKKAHQAPLTFQNHPP